MAGAVGFGGEVADGFAPGFAIGREIGLTGAVDFTGATGFLGAGGLAGAVALTGADGFLEKRSAFLGGACFPVGSVFLFALALTSKLRGGAAVTAISSIDN